MRTSFMFEFAFFLLIIISVIILELSSRCKRSDDFLYLAWKTKSLYCEVHFFTTLFQTIVNLL